MLPPPNPLLPEQRKQLLSYARQTIEAQLRGFAPPHAPAEFTGRRGGGAFVSLHLQGRLRGCIGMVESNLSLPATLARCALGASFEDRRFRPLEQDELERVAIEISLLSPLSPATPEVVQPGLHGLLIRNGYSSGLLLPQVAEKYQWPRERFLEETCVKAGLPPDAWKNPETRIFTFTAEVFSEE